MEVDVKLRSIFFVQERQWSGKVFLLFFCACLGLNLFVALPAGRDTFLVSYGVPNAACVQSSITDAPIKNCNPTLRITPKSTINDYLLFFGAGDPGSYARGGLLLAGMEWGGAYPTVQLPMIARLKLMNLIGFGVWPPGMFFLNALPSMVSADIPLGLYQVIVASTLWAIAFALIASLLILRARLWLALILPVFLMSFPLFHDYLMRSGVMYSETYGAAFMTIGFSLLALFYYRKPANSLMLVAGMCFAVASFFRSQMFPVAVGVSIILAMLYVIRVWSSSADKSETNHRLKIATLTFLLAFYVPIGSYMAINKGALFHAEYAWAVPFSTPAYPDAGDANFLALGGIRAACVVDIRKCEALHKQVVAGTRFPHAKIEVLKSFLLHPVDFSLYKLPIAWRFWMENSGPSESVIVYRYDSILMLAILLFSLIFMMIRKIWLFFCLTLASVALVFGPPFLIHFEVRYFYVIKAFILFLPFWLLFICSPKIPSQAVEPC